jgi:hypothetical protein
MFSLRIIRDGASEEEAVFEWSNGVSRLAWTSPHVVSPDAGGERPELPEIALLPPALSTVGDALKSRGFNVLESSEMLTITQGDACIPDVVISDNLQQLGQVLALCRGLSPTNPIIVVLTDPAHDELRLGRFRLRWHGRQLWIAEQPVYLDPRESTILLALMLRSVTLLRLKSCGETGYKAQKQREDRWRCTSMPYEKRSSRTHGGRIIF